MPNRAPWWTPERVEELRRRRTAGERRQDIAVAMGTTPNAVRRACERLHLYRPDWTAGRGFASIAGRESHTMHRLWCLGPVQPRHKFWSDDAKRTRVCRDCRKAAASEAETGFVSTYDPLESTWGRRHAPVRSDLGRGEDSR